jgi:hypothetical protein
MGGGGGGLFACELEMCGASGDCRNESEACGVDAS